MMKKVYKYGTGETIPKDAVYLCTLIENLDLPISGMQRLVWHYFLVEVEG